jgi:hypothetical protein
LDEEEGEDIGVAMGIVDGSEVGRRFCEIPIGIYIPQRGRSDLDRRRHCWRGR